MKLDICLVQSMFAVNGQVSRKTFHEHYRTLHAESEYPALLAIQYAPLVKLGDKAAFEAQVRSDRSLLPEGYPDFKVHPAGDRTEYLPIVYLEPLARNRSAFGYDPAQSAQHREIIEMARDSGELQVSPPIRLIQGGTDPLGLVVRLPVYRGGARPDNINDRRATFQGLVSGAIRISEHPVGGAWHDVDRTPAEGRVGHQLGMKAGHDWVGDLIWDCAAHDHGDTYCQSPVDRCQVRCKLRIITQRFDDDCRAFLPRNRRDTAAIDPGADTGGIS